MKRIYYISFAVILLSACAYETAKSLKDEPSEIMTTNIQATGLELQIIFEKGKTHNHPLMAFWVEDMEGNYVQTLYVVESVAKGFFKHGDKSSGKWLPGPIRRPASLPYWAHKRNVKETDGLYMPSQQNPVPDAYTGATPQGNFTLNTKTDKQQLKQFRVLFEINQSWDWNNYWHNNKYPFDNDYKSSSQPALVYEVTVDTQNPLPEYEMKLIGHSHWAGKTGELFTDLSSITTAKDIVKSVKIKVER